MRKAGLVCGVLSASLFTVSALGSDAKVTNLEFFRNVFHAQYAPAAWKKSFAQWDLDREIDRGQADASRASSLKDYQKILKHFFDSTRDYHTSISFVSTESANLPFTVQGANGRYFIAYIDRVKLSEDAFPFHVGDELVRFGEQSADEAVKSLLAEGMINTSQTDQKRAELNLTSRTAARGLTVPQGPITIGVKPKGSSRVYTHQLLWSYSEERIPDIFSSASYLRTVSFETSSARRSILNRKMIASDDLMVDSASLGNPYLLGARKAFTPDLGTRIWTSDEKSAFYAYIFKNTDNRLIGYVRIPSYVPDDAQVAVKDFQSIVTLFQATTDGLIIDQVNNPGGSVFYLYALVSMLTDQSVSTPRHRMSLTQADVLSAVNQLKDLATIQNDEDAKKVLKDLDGYPASYQVAQFIRSYCQFLINQYKMGHTLTDPYWIEGADRINPAPDHYTKPILLVINSLDFSGGDFFPAILQDNKRVTTFGTRTAGAGGYVLDFSYPNQFGIAGYRVTGSIAERVDLNPIENLGVKADIEYSITENDLQNGYADYVRAMRNAMASLIH